MGMPSPINLVTIPQTAKRFPITILANGTPNGSTLLSLLIAGGYVADTDGGIVGFKIEATQAGVITARDPFYMANAALAASFTAHGVLVASGVAYTATAAGEVATIGLVSAAATPVPAVCTVYLMTP
jgi:hypothetical protein